MSKWMFVVCCMALGMAAVATADDSYYRIYNYGSGAVAGPINDPYTAPAVSGMRFGDPGHVSGAAAMPSFCRTCFGVSPPPCDPCWGGPCMDWKLIGWYSHYGCGCHKKRCCAALEPCGNGGDCDNSCVTCN